MKINKSNIFFYFLVWLGTDPPNISIFLEWMEQIRLVLNPNFLLVQQKGRSETEEHYRCSIYPMLLTKEERTDYKAQVLIICHIFIFVMSLCCT